MTSDLGHGVVDPAEQAAQLLFRIGFGIICIVLPLSAIVSRRALVVVAPIGVLVLISAALMMKARSGPIRRISAAMASPAGLAGLFLLGWSALSLAWTPYPGPGAERLSRQPPRGIGAGQPAAAASPVRPCS